jgi:hypothetical protein
VHARTRQTIGIVMILLGMVWFLQGINVLPGSFMTGDPKWAVIGGVMLVGGVVLLRSVRRAG